MAEVERIPESKEYEAERAQLLGELRTMLSESTGNRLEDITEASSLYGDLNLTDYDLKRIIYELAPKFEVDADSMYETAREDGEGQTVGDLLDIIMEEKDLG